jgi:hypothetical protein
VLIFRSVRSIVIAPAKTGREVISKMAVIATAQRNKGSESNLKEREERALIIVLRKLIDPKIDLTPAK